MKTYTLCGDKGCCPVIEVDEGEVRIGEAGNLCTLKPSEWDTLKAKVRAGDID